MVPVGSGARGEPVPSGTLGAPGPELRTGPGQSVIAQARPRDLVLPTGAAVQPEPAVGDHALGCRGEPHHGVRPFLRGPEQRAHDLVEPGKAGADPGGVGPPGMHGVEDDPRFSGAPDPVSYTHL